MPNWRQAWRDGWDADGTWWDVLTDRLAARFASRRDRDDDEAEEWYGHGRWRDDDWDHDRDDGDDDDRDDGGFGPPADGRTTLLSDSVNPDSSLDPGELWAGSGNTPFNFAIAENQAAGVEIALKAKVRQSGEEVPFDAATNTYIVPSGTQDTANGSFTSNPGRGAWNFDFSVNEKTDNAGVSPDGSQVRLEFDVDSSAAVDYRTIAEAPFDDYAASGLATASPDGTVFDGSQNPIFGFISGLFPESDPYDVDETGAYNIRLSYLAPETDDDDDDGDDDDLEVLASVEITVEVIAASEFQDLWVV